MAQPCKRPESALQPVAARDILPPIQVNLKGTAVDFVDYFQTRRGILFGILDIANEICIEKYLLPIRNLPPALRERLDFVGCVVPSAPETVAHGAKSLRITDQISFIPDASRDLFARLGTMSASGECRRFMILIDLKAILKFVFLDELSEAQMEEIRNAIEEFPCKAGDSGRVASVPPKLRGPSAPYGSLAPHFSPNRGQGETSKAVDRLDRSSIGVQEKNQRSPKGPSPRSRRESGSNPPISRSKTHLPQSATSIDTQDARSDGQNARSDPQDSSDSSQLTPRTRDLLERRRVQYDISKWVTSILRSSVRKSCVVTAEGSQVVLRGYSYGDVCFEYSPGVVDATLNWGQDGIEVIPEGLPALGSLYHRGGTYRAVNFHLHSPSDHVFENAEPNRPLEVYVVHELSGGRGEKTPLVYAATFCVDEGSTPLPHLFLNSVIKCFEAAKEKNAAVSSSEHCSGLKFDFNPLLATGGQKLVRYFGDLKLFGETVTWVIRMDPISIPLDQMNKVMALLGKEPLVHDVSSHSLTKQATESHTSPRSSTMSRFHTPTLEELFALSFAPLRTPADGGASDTLTAAVDKLIHLREWGQLALKMYADAFAAPDPTDETTGVQLVLVEGFLRRLQALIQATREVVEVARQGLPVADDVLKTLEGSVRANEFHPVRRSLLSSFLDLDTTDWVEQVDYPRVNSPTEPNKEANSVATNDAAACAVTKKQSLSGSLGKKKVVIGRASVSDEDEETDEDRKEARFARIKGRRATGYPGARGVSMKQIVDQQESEDDEDGSEPGDSESVDEDSTGATTLDSHTDGSAENSYVLQDDEYLDEHTPDSETDDASPYMTSPPKTQNRTQSKGKRRKPQSRRVAVIAAAPQVISDDEACVNWEEEDRRKMRFARISSRRPTCHPGLRKKVQHMLDSDSEEEESEDRYSLPKQRKPPKVKAARFSSNVEEEEDGNSSWEETQRRVQRFARISARRPTGHPSLSLNVKDLLQPHSHEIKDTRPGKKEPPRSALKGGVRRSVTQSAAVEMPRSALKQSHRTAASEKVPSKPKSKLKVPEMPKKRASFALPNSEESEASDWAAQERRRDRTQRLQRRRPTGHPSLGRKLGEIL